MGSSVEPLTETDPNTQTHPHTDTPTHRQTQTMSREPANIHGILNTLLVPMEPPNRSQWKKLELAMKFIHLSKQSVVRRKSSQEIKFGLRERSEYKSMTAVASSEERSRCKQKITLKLEPIDKSVEKEKARLKKQKSWDKLKNVAVQILVLPFEF